MGFVWGSLSRTSWFCVLLMLANGACAKTFDCARQPKGKDGFTTAEFRLWVPESVPKLRGVLVLLPGWQGDGRGMADDSAWQAFAEGEGFALLGCHFKVLILRSYISHPGALMLSGPSMETPSCP